MLQTPQRLARGEEKQTRSQITLRGHVWAFRIRAGNARYFWTPWWGPAKEEEKENQGTAGWRLDGSGREFPQTILRAQEDHGWYAWHQYPIFGDLNQARNLRDSQHLRKLKSGFLPHWTEAAVPGADWREQFGGRNNAGESKIRWRISDV